MPPSTAVTTVTPVAKRPTARRKPSTVTGRASGRVVSRVVTLARLRVSPGRRRSESPGPGSRELRLPGVSGLQDVGDLRADQLVPLQQRVAQSLDEVPVGVEQVAGGCALLREQLLHRSASLEVL